MTFDYNSILQRLVNYLNAKSEHSNLLYYSTDMKLLETVTQETEFLARYNDYLARENQWELAQNITSLLTQTDLLNYTVRRKVGSRGIIRVSTSSAFNSTYAQDIQISKYTTFASSDGKINFVADEYFTLFSTNQYTDITVVQGSYKSSTFTAYGVPNESFTVKNGSIENTALEVTVNEIPWAIQDNLFSSLPTDLHFRVSSLNDFSGIEIIFGDGNFGKHPSAGDVVKVQYIETLGADGNITSANVVTKVISTLYDVLANKVTLYCKNEDVVIGGVNEPTIETIRYEAPKVFQTGMRAISLTDYEVFLKAVTFIQKVVVWGAYEQNLDAGVDPWTYVPTEENRIFISGITTANEPISDAQKVEIIKQINPIKSPTDLMQFIEPDFIYLDFIVSAYVVNSSYTLPSVKTAIEQAVVDAYSIGNTDFNTNIYESDYQALIDNVPGVRYHDTTLSIYGIRDFESGEIGGEYNSSFQLPIYPIDPTKVKIYCKLKTSSTWVQVGYCSPAGVITPLSGYTITGSSINITNGSGLLSIQNNGGTILFNGLYTLYEIKIEYAPSGTNNLLLSGRNQFTLYHSATVNVQYSTKSRK